MQYGFPNGGQHFVRQTRQYNDNDMLKFKCTITPKVEAFGKSFFVRTVNTWNNLPMEIRNIDIFDKFKTILKEHLWLIAEQDAGLT